MSFPYLNPISPLRVFGPESVSREKSYGTNFSTLSVGGYMEVFSLDQLRYTIPPLTYGQVNYSGNSIPITYSIGSGSTFSYNTLILNPDNISSGRKKIGMLVYVKDENQIYQFNINNYDTLWNAATGATGVGGSTVVISSFGSTVKANTPEGIAFISGWTANTIDGVSGYTYETAVWKKYYGSNLSLTGGTYDPDLGTLSLKNITGGTVNVTGFTSGGGFFVEENNVQSWTLTGKNLSVTGQDNNSVGIFFKPDGLRMFIIGATNDRVFQYNLSTAWDASTSVVDPSSLSIVAQDSNMTDVFISPDGLILYTVGSTNDRVYRYNLSTPWDVNTGVFTNSLSVSGYSTSPTGLFFKSDGTKLFVVDSVINTVFTIDLSTPWDITTGVQTQSFVVSGESSVSQAISFNNSGTTMYILDSGLDDIIQYDLSVPWDITTSVYVSVSFRSLFEPSPGGLYYNETANVAYYVGASVDTVYGLSTLNDILITNNSIGCTELYVNGRSQINDTLIVGSALSVGFGLTISSSGSITAGGNLTVGGSGSIATANNIGSTTTATSHNFGNGAVGTGTKIVNIAPSGLIGSNTVVNLGNTVNTILNSVSTQNNFKRDVSVNGYLTVEGQNISISPTGTIEFQDTFTEAVTTALQSHIPNIGSGWTKSYAGTVTNVNVFSAGYASPAATVANSGVIYTTNNTFTSANYQVDTLITAWTSSDDSLWIYFRYIDLNNYYAIRVSTTTTDFRLYKRVGGVLTAIFSSIGLTIAGTPQTLSVRVIGDSITLLLDSVVLGTYYDSDLTLAGRCGIGFGNTNVGLTTDDMSAVWRLDSFQVRMYTSTDIGGTSYINNGSFVVGNTSANTSAKLEVVSTSQGFLPPRMTNTQRTSIGSPAQGLIVYDTTGSTEGLYYYGSGSTIGWQKVLTNSSPVNLTGFSNGNILFASGSTGLITGSTNLFWDNTNGRLGVGTSNPSYRVDVTGTTLVDSSVSAQGSFNLNPVTNPSTITGFTLSVGSSLGIGLYYYRVAYVTALGETGASGSLTVTTTSGNTTVNLSGIPISSDPRVTARKLYRTTVNGFSDNQRFLATISNNTATTYTDTIPDASLGAVAGQSYKVNTTSRYITTNGVQGMIIDNNLVTLGLNAGAGVITSNNPTIRSVFIGTGAGQSVTTGVENTTVGGLAGGFLSTGNYNTIMGGLAGYLLTTASSNTLIGYQTARYLTTGGSNTIVGGSAANLLTDGVTQFSAGTNNTVVGRVIRMLTASDTNSIVIGDAANGLGSNTTVIGNSSTTFSSIFGNLGVATTTNAGFRLDVNGTARIQGLTRSTDVFIIGGSATTNTANARFWSSGGQAVTSGLYRGFYTDITWVPTSGSAEWYGLDLRPTINQTGGANGITRGLYIAPTLTSAFDFRAIETTLGNVMLNTVSGNTLIGKSIDTGQKLQVSGNTLINGGLTATTITAINPTKNQYICDIGLAADQTITTTVDTLIDFIDVVDNYDWYDTLNKRFRPTIEGYYHIDFNAWFEPATVSTGQYNIQLRKNGNTVAIIQQPTINNGTGQSLTCSKLVYLNGTSDYLDFTAYQSTGVNRRLQVGSSSSGTYATIFLLAI
jgi:hypothetical protein